MNKPNKWPSLSSLFRFLLVINVSQSKHKNPFPDPSSHTCGCPAKNSGLIPNNKFFKFQVEQTEVEPEYLAIMIALKKNMYFIKIYIYIEYTILINLMLYFFKNIYNTYI